MLSFLIFLVILSHKSFKSRLVFLILNLPLSILTFSKQTKTYVLYYHSKHYCANISKNNKIQVNITFEQFVLLKQTGPKPCPHI